MTAQALIDSLLDRSKASELFPVSHEFDEDRIFLVDHAANGNQLGWCLVCDPICYLNDSVAAAMRSALSLEVLPGTTLNFQIAKSTYIEDILEVYQHGRVAIDGRGGHLDPKQQKLIRTLTKYRTDLYRKGVSEAIVADQDVMLASSIVVVSGQIPIEKVTKDALAQAKTLRVKIQQILHGLGMKPKACNGESYKALMSALLYEGKRPDRHFDKEDRVGNQILRYDTTVSAEHADGTIQVGNKIYRSLSCQDFRRRASMVNTALLAGDLINTQAQIRDPYIFTAVVRFPDNEKRKGELETKAQNLRYWASGKLSTYAPELVRRHRGMEVLQSSIMEGERVVELWLNMMIISKDREVSDKVATTFKTYSSSDGFRFTEDKGIEIPCFINILPMCFHPRARDDLDRFNTMSSAQAAQFIPVVSDWKGTGPRGELIGFSRRGQVTLVDRYDSATNFNAVISGGSGSGKSYLVNDLVTGNLAKGEKVRIIDVGRSYEKVCEQLGGEFLDVGKTKDNYNPFSNISNIKEEVEGLLDLLAVMAAPNEGLTDRQRKLLNAIILELWEEHGSSVDANGDFVQSPLTITMLSERCLKEGLNDSSKADLIGIAQMLFPFTRHGQYHELFEGRSTIKFASPFVVLELDSLSGMPELQKVILMILIQQLKREVYGSAERNVVYNVYVDECWQLLVERSAAAFIIGAYRKFRKYGSGMTICTQSIADAWDTEGGRAIIDNAASKYLLMQNEDSLKKLIASNMLTLSDGEIELLKSVRTAPGMYSEVFCMTTRGSGVIRVVHDRFTQLLFTSMNTENLRIRRYLAQGMDCDSAIRAVMLDETRAKAQAVQNA